MTEDDLLEQHTRLKKGILKTYITRYLGHEPTPAEMRRFTIMHSLTESKIFFRGRLVGHLRYHARANTVLAEFLEVE